MKWIAETFPNSTSVHPDNFPSPRFIFHGENAQAWGHSLAETLNEYESTYQTQKQTIATLTTGLEGQWAKPEFEYLALNRWTFTEKVDGTNVRASWPSSEENEVLFQGKTDRAQLPPFLLDRLKTVLTPDKMTAVFPDVELFSENQVVLYGEGFGARIQKGGSLYGEPDFILFDVLYITESGSTWLERENVADIAGRLGIRAVPEIGSGTLRDAVEHARCGLNSQLKEGIAEGLVMRPAMELSNRRGHRIIAKIKTKDFQS